MSLPSSSSSSSPPPATSVTVGRDAVWRRARRAWQSAMEATDRVDLLEWPETWDAREQWISDCNAQALQDHEDEGAEEREQQEHEQDERLCRPIGLSATRRDRRTLVFGWRGGASRFVLRLPLPAGVTDVAAAVAARIDSVHLVVGNVDTYWRVHGWQLVLMHDACRPETDAHSCCAALRRWTERVFVALRHSMAALPANLVMEHVWRMHWRDAECLCYAHLSASLRRLRASAPTTVRMALAGRFAHEPLYELSICKPSFVVTLSEHYANNGEYEATMTTPLLHAVLHSSARCDGSGVRVCRDTFWPKPVVPGDALRLLPHRQRVYTFDLSPSALATCIVLVEERRCLGDHVDDDDVSGDAVADAFDAVQLQVASSTCTYVAAEARCAWTSAHTVAYCLPLCATERVDYARSRNFPLSGPLQAGHYLHTTCVYAPITLTFVGAVRRPATYRYFAWHATIWGEMNGVCGTRL